MTTANVTATFKGEYVYLGVTTIGTKELITLNFVPVDHTETKAERIAALAAADETLTGVTIERVRGRE